MTETLNSNQIALLVFMGWYLQEDTFINQTHVGKMLGVLDGILIAQGQERIEDTRFEIQDWADVPINQGKSVEEAYKKLVIDRVKDGNLPDDLERLMIRLTTMDLKLITEEIILSTVKAWNYGFKDSPKHGIPKWYNMQYI
jgi:hypothetical protein